MAEHGAGEPTVESKLVYEGRILDLRVDTVRLPSGRLTTREIAEHSDSVCMVPLDNQGKVLLVRQYRKSVESNLLEVPAGGIDENEAPEAAALRELQEEVGYTARKIVRLAGFWVSPGWCTEFMYAYLATELSPAQLEADFDEDIAVIRVPLADTLDLITRGEIQDAKSVASLLLAMRHLDDN
jgi:ADP-ribose pyrophosphatase